MPKQPNTSIKYYSKPAGVFSTFGKLCTYVMRKNAEEESSRHLHECLELGLCLEGSGIFCIEDKIFPFSPGDMVIINEYEFHRAIPTDQAEWYFIHINTSKLKTGLAEEDGKLETAGLCGSAFCNLRKAATEVELRNMLDLLIGEMKRDSQSVSTRHMLRYVVTFLVANYRTGPDTERPPVFPSDIQRLAPALAMISTQYNRNLTIRDLADKCAMSDTSFRRLFVKTFRKTPNDYLTYYRIQMGAHLLRYEHYGVEEAAEAVGYQSQSAFYKNFKKQYRQSPISYRLWKSTESEWE